MSSRISDDDWRPTLLYQGQYNESIRVVNSMELGYRMNDLKGP